MFLFGDYIESVRLGPEAVVLFLILRMDTMCMKKMSCHRLLRRRSVSRLKLPVPRQNAETTSKAPHALTWRVVADAQVVACHCFIMPSYSLIRLSDVNPGVSLDKRPRASVFAPFFRRAVCLGISQPSSLSAMPWCSKIRSRWRARLSGRAWNLRDHRV